MGDKVTTRRVEKQVKRKEEKKARTGERQAEERYK